jgi:hypothetical protein
MIFRRWKRIRRAAALGLVAAAVAAPTAGAVVPDRHGGTAEDAVTSSTGFDWRDAGIGFGVALGVALGLAGSARVIRQTRRTSPAL